MTESSSCAIEFAERKVKYNGPDYSDWNPDVNDNLFFIFVNEILESEMLKEIVVKETKKHITTDPRENQFEKYIKRGAAVKRSDETYERDSNGRKIKYAASRKTELNNFYVCHENLVVPRYLVQCFPNYK